MIHSELSSYPFGEEDLEEMKLITTAIALNLPWTSQLRLATREKRFQSLLPHVWSRLQQYPTGKAKEEEDFGSLLFDDDGWREEYMIQNWNMTRFHMERENQPGDDKMSKSLYNTLKLILDRISEVLGLDLENREPMRSPWDIVNLEDEIGDEKQPISSEENSSPSFVHPEFSTWVATTTTSSSSKRHFQQLVLDLCRLMGSDRRMMMEQFAWEGLPLDRVAKELCQLERDCMEETVQRGRAYLLSILQSKRSIQGARLELDPLPEGLWSCITTANSDDSQLEVSLEQSLQSYLTTTNLPNVNAVVIFLWTYHRDKLPLVKKLSQWLPIEPVIPLMCRFLTEQENGARNEVDIEIAMEFVLSLEWEKHHLDSIMGQDVTIPVTSKELADTVTQQYSKKARRKSVRDLSISNKKMKTAAATTQAQVIQQLFGDSKLGKGKEILAMDVDQDDDGYSMKNYENSAINDIWTTDSDSDSSFDESDDRILLL